jgi:hypothetical protein
MRITYRYKIPSYNYLLHTMTYAMFTPFVYIEDMYTVIYITYIYTIWLFNIAMENHHF